MDMPTPCARCRQLGELDDMWPTTHVDDRTGSAVECDDCHHHEESDA